MTRMPWGLLALVALALAPGVAACTLQEPCVLAVEVTDTALTVAPTAVDGAGPFVLAARNLGAQAATVSLSDSPLALQVPANGTARSDPFSFSQGGRYVLSAGDRHADLVVSGVPAGPGKEPGVAGDTPDNVATLLQPATLLPIVVGLALVGLATLVARTGWQQRHNRIFAALYLLSGLNSITQGILPVAEGFHAQAPLFPGLYPWLLVQITCAVLMLPLLFLFVLNFPRPMPWAVRHPRLQWLAFTVSLIFGGLFWSILLRGMAGAPLDEVIADLALPFEGFNVLATAVIFAATFLLFRTQHAASSAIERRQAGYLLLGFFPAFAATTAITLLGFAFRADAVQYQQPVQLYISPVLELGAAAVTAFAILKYRLLDFELKVKGGMRYVLMTVMLGTVLFLVEVYVGNFILQAKVFGFLGPAGSATLAGISGIVLFKPVHKVSGKVTDRLFPEATAPKVDYERSRSREIYQAQATHVLRDAQVTDRELQFLRTLRDQLGLSEAEAQRIEEAVERELGVDDERTGTRRMGSQAAPVRPAAAEPLPPPEAVVLDASGQPTSAPAVAAPKPRKVPARKPAASPQADEAGVEGGGRKAPRPATPKKPAGAAASKPTKPAGKPSPKKRS
ncbi:MAG TPA: hypothetical protein VM286_07410 [Candidatus Thermoplasmatota archaeon]|nr:hypothetical protein [Candidatus Thermoplasmatota archaeon]